MSFPYIIQGDNIMIVVDNKPHNVNRTHPAFQKVLDAIKSGDDATVRDLIEPKKAVLKFAQGNVTIEGSRLFWKHRELHSTLAARMIAMLGEGFDIKPMAAFMENLMQNPSKRAIDELYGFLEAGQLPITPDGHFLAYKKVRDDFYDVYTGTVLNAPAHKMTQEQRWSMPIVSNHDDRVTVFINNSGLTEVTMDRSLVDDDKDRTCSNGLHFCSRDYLTSFGGSQIVILKINPADVVSIPSDYNNTKGRTCRYQVLDVLGVAPERAFTSTVQDTAAGCRPVEKPAKTAPLMSVGSTDYHLGYDDGYNDCYYDRFKYANNQAYNDGYSDGEADFLAKKDALYVYSNPEAKTVPPRQGSSDFYRGYSDGYNEPGYNWDHAASRAYNEGYDKGEARREAGLDARYVYVKPEPVKPAQEYDRNGRPLSMTKDAIRKRQVRAAQARNRGV